jgi:hypothetical protein
VEGAEAGLVRFQGRIDPADPDYFEPYASMTFTATGEELGPRFGASIAAGSEGPNCCGHMAVGIPAPGASGRVLLMAAAPGFSVAPIDTLAPPPDFEGGGFGNAVAASLGVFVVGAPGDAGSDATGGEVYIFTNAQEVAVPRDPELPRHLRIESAFPNPARDEVHIRLNLPVPAMGHVKVHDVLGREHLSMRAAFMPAGVHDVALDTSKLPAGVYAITIFSGGNRARRLVVIQP